MNELKTKNKNKITRDMYTGINKFKKECKPGNLVKHKNGDWLQIPMF
jgi:hypothetical protein